MLQPLELVFRYSQEFPGVSPACPRSRGGQLAALAVEGARPSDGGGQETHRSRDDRAGPS